MRKRRLQRRKLRREDSAPRKRILTFRVHMKAILFASHLISPSIYWTFRRLRRADSATYDTMWLYDNSVGPTPWPVRRNRYYTFSAGQLIDEEYPFAFGNSLHSNTHLPVLKFHKENRDYTHYWIIEYDVRFTGDWGFFFDSFDENDSDFLTAAVSRYPNAREFRFWDTLSHPSTQIPERKRVRSFNPIYRISAEALDFILRSHRDGWSGHQEVLLPTLLHNNGFTVEDFGGDGAFVPDRRTNTWYTSRNLNNFGVPDEGTHRFRPRFWKTGPQPNRIYHPVKPVSWFAKRGLAHFSDLDRFLNPSYVYRKAKQKIQL